MRRALPLLLLSPLLLFATSFAQGKRSSRLAKIPTRAALAKAPDRYLTVFEVRDDALIAKHVREEGTDALGLACWDRIVALFPTSYRKLIVQFNVMRGRRLAGFFGGAGKNDVGRKGYALSVAKYCLQGEKRLRDPFRKVSARRGTLDWTLVHELGHYVCLRTNTIELFSQSFDGDTAPARPKRRKQPDDYAKDGSPRLKGNFVTSYAERSGGDEEVVETFTTYMTAAKLPTGDSLVEQKLRFFDTIPGFPELRKHIQSVTKRKRKR